MILEKPSGHRIFFKPQEEEEEEEEEGVFCVLVFILFYFLV